MRTMRVFFASSRYSWTRYKSFFMDTLNDARAWPMRWVETRNLQTADWAVELASSKTISDVAPGLPGLSVTMMAYVPRLTLFNYENWMRVPDAAPKEYSLAQYRTYLILHECGHALGLGHPRASVRQSNGASPVMVQQTRGIGNLKPNIWPLESEKRSV